MKDEANNPQDHDAKDDGGDDRLRRGVADDNVDDGKFRIYNVFDGTCSYLLHFCVCFTNILIILIIFYICIYCVLCVCRSG